MIFFTTESGSKYTLTRTNDFSETVPMYSLKRDGTTEYGVGTSYEDVTVRGSLSVGESAFLEYLGGLRYILTTPITELGVIR